MALSKEDLAKVLVESVKDVFKTMLAVDLVDGDQPREEAAGVQLICTIGLAGKLEGSVSVCLPNKAACAIVSKMLSTEMTEMCPDVCDGMGEVANMVSGGIKMRTTPLNYTFQLSIPTVVQGELMHLNIAAGLERIVKHFEGAGFSFSVDFIYKLVEAEGEQPKAAASAGASKLSALEKLKAMTAKANH